MAIQDVIPPVFTQLPPVGSSFDETTWMIRTETYCFSPWSGWNIRMPRPYTNYWGSELQLIKSNQPATNRQTHFGQPLTSAGNLSRPTEIGLKIMIWVFPKIGKHPKMDGLWLMENPMKMWWFGGKTHYFRKHPYLVLWMDQPVANTFLSNPPFLRLCRSVRQRGLLHWSFKRPDAFGIFPYTYTFEIEN